MNDTATPDEPRPASLSDTATHWPAIFILFLSGCTVALHIGKAPSALPLLRDEFGLSLTQAGSVISTYSILIGVSGLFFGLLVTRVGHVRFAIIGVALSGVGSILGTIADSLVWLLVSRAIEGAGWIIAVVALPSIIGLLASARDRPLAMGMWGAFVPVGTGLMLLLAPAAQQFGGWRLSWIIAAFASLIAVLCIWRQCVLHSERLIVLASTKASPPMKDLRKPVTYFVGLCFFCYSFQFISVTAFLPTLFLEQLSMSLTTASRFTAVVILANAFGNVIAGYLLRRGIPHHVLLSSAAALMGCLAFITYNSAVPAPARLVSAIGFTLIGGIIPGTLFALVPIVASMQAAVSVIVGLMLQMAGLGQWLGPLALPLVVEYFGDWRAAGVLMLVVGMCGAVFASGLRIIHRGD